MRISWGLLLLLVFQQTAAPGQPKVYESSELGLSQQLPEGWVHVPPDVQVAARRAGHQQAFGNHLGADADDKVIQKCSTTLLWLIPEGANPLSADPVPTFVLAVFDLPCLSHQAPTGAQQKVELPRGKQRTYFAGGIPISETTMKRKVRLQNGKKQQVFAVMRVAYREDRVFMWAIGASSKAQLDELLSLDFRIAAQ